MTDDEIAAKVVEMRAKVVGMRALLAALALEVCAERHAAAEARLARLDAVREAILRATDCMWGITVPMMLAISPDDGEKVAHVWNDKEHRPRMLCLEWPAAQVLFAALGLTSDGAMPPRDT